MIRTVRSALFVLIALVGVGCGERSTRVASGKGGEPSSAITSTTRTLSPCEKARAKPGSGTLSDYEGQVDILWAPGGGINDRSQTNAAVIGKVVEVSELIWNSTDGRPWSGRRAQVFRRITLDVERVLWTDAAVGAEAGKPTVLHFLGDGSDCGTRVWGRLSPRANIASGPVNVGDRRLLLLSHEDTLFEEGMRPMTLNRSYVNNWRLRDDGIAENMDPAGSVPTDKLIDRLQKEHAKGRIKDNAAANRDNETTDQNPLATEFTP